MFFIKNTLLRYFLVLFPGMTFSSASLSTFDNRNSSVSCGLSSASPNFNRENRNCDMFKLTCFFKKCRTLSIPKIIFVVLLVCLMTSTIHAKKAQDGMNLQIGNFDLKSQAESERVSNQIIYHTNILCSPVFVFWYEL